MRTVVIHSAGDLRVERRAAPDPDPSRVRVRILAGGICGSDLHYFQHGGFGSVRLREPMILGHEVAGRVVRAPEGAGLAPGDTVAVSPSRPCGACRFCAEGLPNHCENMRFYGSAMPFPHIQGAFRDEIDADPAQCVRADVAPEIAAFAEPLAVVLHALSRAGEVRGARVLVTGCGPIGALAILAARAAGAAEITAVDRVPHVLEIAARIGADRTHSADDWAEPYAAGKGHFDVALECSGAAPAVLAALRTLRPRGVLVQVGLGADVPIPLTQIAAREVDIRGAFRFAGEFADAVAMLNDGRIDPTPLLTARFPVDKAVDAFEMAGDRARAVKVGLDFT